MGFYTEGGIRKFEPDNTPDTLYIRFLWTRTFGEIAGMIRDHFEINDIRNFKIEAENIQTDYIGYDGYDSGDYTQFLVISRK